MQPLQIWIRESSMMLLFVEEKKQHLDILIAMSTQTNGRPNERTKETIYYFITLEMLNLNVLIHVLNVQNS